MRRKVYATKEIQFEAAHHLVNYDGDCSRVHGHSYKLKVTVSGYIDPVYSKYATDLMVVDFKDLNRLIRDHIIRTHDHADLNTLYDNPTAEVMAVVIFDTLKDLLPKDTKIESVKLWETSSSYVEYRGEEK